MDTTERIAQVLEHYLRVPIERSGLRWTARNRADMRQLARLITRDDDLADDVMPPYQPAPELHEQERITIALERNPANDDPNFRAWRQRRQQDDNDQARRLLARERNGR